MIPIIGYGEGLTLEDPNNRVESVPPWLGDSAETFLGFQTHYDCRFRDTEIVFTIIDEIIAMDRTIRLNITRLNEILKSMAPQALEPLKSRPLQYRCPAPYHDEFCRKKALNEYVNHYTDSHSEEFRTIKSETRNLFIRFTQAITGLRLLCSLPPIES